MPTQNISSLLSLRNKTVIVTGASGHIGGAIAQTLAEAGANLLLQYHRNSEAVDRLVTLSEPVLGSISSVQADLSQFGAAEAVVEKAVADFGTVYGLVNNAGIQPVAAFDDIRSADFDQMMSTNVTGPFSLIQSCARVWSKSPDMASVVNIASIEGQQPAIGHSHYSTSKAALIMLTKSAAIELGKHDIRVNSISPGLIEREGIREGWPDGVERWEKSVPLRRMGTPQDVAMATLFLLSDAAKWISGTNLNVDGGMLARPNW